MENPYGYTANPTEETIKRQQTIEPADYNSKFFIPKKRRSDYNESDCKSVNENQLFPIIKMENPLEINERDNFNNYPGLVNFPPNQTMASTTLSEYFHRIKEERHEFTTTNNNHAISQPPPQLSDYRTVQQEVGPQIGDHFMNPTSNNNTPPPNYHGLSAESVQILQALATIKNDLRMLTTMVESQRTEMVKLKKKVADQSDILSSLVLPLRRRSESDRNIQIDPVFIPPDFPIRDLQDLIAFNDKLREKNYMDQMVWLLIPLFFS